MGSEMERCLKQENKFGAKLAGNDKVYGRQEVTASNLKTECEKKVVDA